MEKVIVYSQGICTCSACVDNKLPLKKIEETINTLSPTGISSKWEISKDKTFADGSPNPCPCNTHPTKRKHYLFNC